VPQTGRKPLPVQDESPVAINAARLALMRRVGELETELVEANRRIVNLESANEAIKSRERVLLTEAQGVAARWKAKVRKWRRRARQAEGIAQHRLELVEGMTTRWPLATAEAAQLHQIVDMINTSEWWASHYGPDGVTLATVEPDTAAAAVRLLLDRLDADEEPAETGPK
jgi:hypothetical protein